MQYAAYGNKYNSWIQDCLERQKDIKRINAAYKARPRYYAHCAKIVNDYDFRADIHNQLKLSAL